MKVAILGAGGITYHLWEDIIRYLLSLEKKSSLYVIDGDSVELNNLTRQFFPSAIGKNKAIMIATMAKERFDLDGHVMIHAVPEYLNHETLEKHRSLWIDRCYLFLGCVDRDGVRVFLETEVARKKNAIYVVGGNDNHGGQAQAYVRKSGRNILPKVSHIAPEILADKDPLPGEGGCLESGPQTALANKATAVAMEILVHHVLSKAKPSINEIRVDTRTGKMIPLLQKSLVTKGRSRGSHKSHHDRTGTQQRSRGRHGTDRTHPQ